MVSLSLVGTFAVGDVTNEATIYRDIYGVPHIYADSEYELMYGLGYAMGEDQLKTLVTLYRTANGTRPAIEGRGMNGMHIYSAYITQLFRVPQSAATAYALISAQERLWLDGFSDGLNAYIREYNDAHPPPAIEEFTSEDVLAWAIYRQFVRQLAQAQMDLENGGIGSPILSAALPKKDISASNQWVVGAAKTGGPAIVAADPHLPWRGGTQWYEAHLKDTAGVLNITGAAVLGMPLITMGHNEQVAWSLTSNNLADSADCYEERLYTPWDPSEYVYDPAPSGRKPIVRQVISIPVKDQSEPTLAPAFYTHHGPVIPIGMNGSQLIFTEDGEHIYSFALSSMDNTPDDYPGDIISRILLQMYRMDTAESVRDIKLALGLDGEPDSYPVEEALQMVKWNIVAADTTGDIFYIYNGRIPVREDPHQEDSGYWDKPLQGWTGLDEWARDPQDHAEFWNFSELPQVENPASGLLANCNVAPWHVAPDTGIDPADYPHYVAIELDTDRNRRIRELLEGDAEVTDYDMRLYSLDARLPVADKLETLLFSFYDPQVYPLIEDAVNVLAAESNDATKDNTSIALIHAWVRALGGAFAGLPDDPALLTEEQKTLLIDSLRGARNFLNQCAYGFAPPWGDLHRIEYGDSFDVGGGTHEVQSLFMVSGNHTPCGTYQCVSGSSFMQVSVLDPGNVDSRSVRPIGSDGDPGSPHYNDETARYAERDPDLSYKPNPFTDSDVTTVYLESTKVLQW